MWLASLDGTRLLCHPVTPGTLLNYYNDHPTAGHRVSKTLARLRFRFLWPKVVVDVKCYVPSCSDCQLTKPSLYRLRNPGNTQMWIMLDHCHTQHLKMPYCWSLFSKWIDVCAVREATAQVADGRFVNEVYQHTSLTQPQNQVGQIMDGLS